MVVRKQKRSRYQRGRRTGGWGFGKRHRGKGSRGGHGHSGAGKRGAHKVSFYTAHGGTISLGKRGMQFKARTYKIPVKTISIEELDKMASRLEKKVNVGQVMEAAKKFAEEQKLGTLAKEAMCIIDLSKEGYTKVLGQGKLNHKLKIICHQFSESAKKKIEKAGGEAVTPKE